MAKIYLDKYYTPKPLAKKVVDIVERDIAPIGTFTRVIEPSVGGGVFMEFLKNDNVIAYDIEPHCKGKNIIKADYLKTNIEYLKNSIVIGNPPFDNGSASNLLHKDFIIHSIKHSDYVAFILPKNALNLDNIKEAKLIKSYKLPILEYSGVKVKCCLNLYKRRMVEKKERKLKGVKIYNFEKSKDTTMEDVKQWIDTPFDYRIVTLGRVRLLNAEDRTRVSEIKIKFEKPFNFRHKLESFFNYVKKNSGGKECITVGAIKNFIWENCPHLREETE